MPANLTYNVNTLSDAANLPAGMITLRQAITSANTAAVGDNVTITFKTNANVALTGTILLESVLPDISKNVKILGSGENNLAISRDPAAAKFGIFTIDKPATVTIQDVSISGGDNPNVGGAVFNLGTLTLLNDLVFDNKAAFGGGLDNEKDATATLTNVAFNNNIATCGGGISNAGTLGLNNSFINANYATDNSGGGIYNVSTGILNISATSIHNNYAKKIGGGISTSGVLNWNGGDLTNNTTGNLGNGGGIAVFMGVTVKLKNLSITGNDAQGGVGGGIYINAGEVDLDTCTLSGNHAGAGPGAFYSKTFGKFTFTLNCTITDEIDTIP